MKPQISKVTHDQHVIICDALYGKTFKDFVIASKVYLTREMCFGRSVERVETPFFSGYVKIVTLFLPFISLNIVSLHHKHTSQQFCDGIDGGLSQPIKHLVSA